MTDEHVVHRHPFEDLEHGALGREHGVVLLGEAAGAHVEEQVAATQELVETEVHDRLADDLQGDHVVVGVPLLALVDALQQLVGDDAARGVEDRLAGQQDLAGPGFSGGCEVHTGDP
ncbi:MAG: hypothetical protein R2749_26170 [Acidimicrobiales bacterium]